MVNQIDPERKVKKHFGTSKFENSEGPENVLGMSLINLPGRPLNVRLGRPLDVISGRPQVVRLRRPRDGRIGSLGDVLRTLEGDLLGTSVDQYLSPGLC